MEGERRLSALHPKLVALSDGAGGWTGLGGWQIASGTTLFHESVIDLSGYAMESLTFFPQAIGLQDPGIYQFKGSDASPYTGLQVLDIITSVPLSSVALAANAQAAGTGPGMIGSKLEFETLLFGMYRFFSLNTNIPYADYLQLERSQRFDSGEPNAADKLFCYRIVTTLSQDLQPDSYVSIPAARQLIGGMFSSESELVYMQRLKRSYELANQL